MADHRAPTRNLTVPFLRMFTPSAFRKLTATVIAHQVVSLLVWASMTVALMVIGSWYLAIPVAVFGFAETVLLHFAAVRWADEGEHVGGLIKAQSEHLAAKPGGAPMIAQLTAHCGCVHRWAFNASNGEWVPMEIVESSDQCLAEAR